MENINVSLEAFSGPLELLVHLIEKNEIDIYDIPISLLTEQYMAYIDSFSRENMEQLSEFLLMAATLLEIKSKMLLPKVLKEECDDVDPRAELVARLIEYKQFKNVLHLFAGKEVDARKFVTREPDELLIKELRQNTPLSIEDLLKDVTSRKLYELFTQATSRKELKTDVVRSGFKSIPKDTFTIEDKMDYLQTMLRLHKIISFNQLFEACAVKIEVVVTFLALLELVKLKKIQVKQDCLFDCIEIVAVI